MKIRALGLFLLCAIPVKAADGPWDLYRRNCEASDRARAPYLEAGIAAIRERAESIRGSALPEIDRYAAELAGSLKPETLALFQKIAAALDARAHETPAREGRRATLDDAYGTREGFLKSEDRKTLYRMMIADLSTDQRVGVEDRIGVLLRERATGRDLQTEVDPNFDLLFYGGFEPQIVIRTRTIIPAGPAPVLRFEVPMLYTADIKDGKAVIKPVAPTATLEQVLNSTSFVFVDPRDLEKGARTLFAYQDGKRERLADQRGSLSVRIAPGPDVSAFFEGVEYYKNPCTKMAPLIAP